MNANYIKNILNYTNNVYSVKVIKKYLNNGIKIVKNIKDIVIFCEKYADETDSNVMMWNMMNYLYFAENNFSMIRTYKNMLKNYNKKILLNELSKKSLKKEELFNFIFENYKNRDKVIYETMKNIAASKGYELEIASNSGYEIYLLLTECEILTTEEFINLFGFYYRRFACNINTIERFHAVIKGEFIQKCYKLPEIFVKNIISKSKLLIKEIEEHYYASNRKEILELFLKN